MSDKDNRQEEKQLIDIVELVTDFLKIFCHMWLWVIIFMVLFGGLFYMRARTSYTPVYTAYSTFTITVSSDVETSGSVNSYFDNTTAQQMADTFPYILQSSVLRRRVENEMGTSIASVNISASAQADTNLFTITVTDLDGERAYEVLQCVIENYPEFSETIVGRTTMNMLDESGIPKNPDNAPDYLRPAVKGALLGFVLVAIWSLLLISLRRTIRKESDIRRYLNSKCLGTVPNVNAKRRSSARNNLKMLVTEDAMEDVLAEPFRGIRNKIEYYGKEYKNRSFLVTSALAGEGKSTIAVNTAISLAQTGNRVVLIDCDLRNPSDRQILGLEEGPGLAEVLKRECKLEEIVMKADDMNLDPTLQIRFIPGGRPLDDGSDLLGSGRMNRIIEILSAGADYIIIDTAPAGILTDAVVLAQYTDSAVVVVRKDFAKIGSIMDGMEHLAESKIQIIGCVLNGG